MEAADLFWEPHRHNADFYRTYFSPHMLRIVQFLGQGRIGQYESELEEYLYDVLKCSLVGKEGNDDDDDDDTTEEAGLHSDDISLQNPNNSGNSTPEQNISLFFKSLYKNLPFDQEGEFFEILENLQQKPPYFNALLHMAATLDQPLLLLVSFFMNPTPRTQTYEVRIYEAREFVERVRGMAETARMSQLLFDIYECLNWIEMYDYTRNTFLIIIDIILNKSPAHYHAFTSTIPKVVKKDHFSLKDDPFLKIQNETKSVKIQFHIIDLAFRLIDTRVIFYYRRFGIQGYLSQYLENVFNAFEKLSQNEFIRRIICRCGWFSDDLECLKDTINFIDQVNGDEDGVQHHHDPKRNDGPNPRPNSLLTKPLIKSTHSSQILFRNIIVNLVRQVSPRILGYMKDLDPERFEEAVFSEFDSTLWQLTSYKWFKAVVPSRLKELLLLLFSVGAFRDEFVKRIVNSPKDQNPFLHFLHNPTLCDLIDIIHPIISDVPNRFDGFQWLEYLWMYFHQRCNSICAKQSLGFLFEQVPTLIHKPAGVVSNRTSVPTNWLNSSNDTAIRSWYVANGHDWPAQTFYPPPNRRPSPKLPLTFLILFEESTLSQRLIAEATLNPSKFPLNLNLTMTLEPKNQHFDFEKWPHSKPQQSIKTMTPLAFVVMKSVFEFNGPYTSIALDAIDDTFLIESLVEYFIQTLLDCTEDEIHPNLNICLPF